MTLAASTPLIYHLKIVLRDITPQVWRRVQVAATTTIADLHAIIQTAMGWEDAHLHQLLIYGKAYGVYHDGGFSFADDPDQVRLADFRLRVGERFRYDYDMGDFWQHDIWIEHIRPAVPHRVYPHCHAGSGACPPEDCGGPPGYRALLRERTSWDMLDPLHAAMQLILERVQTFAAGGERKKLGGSGLRG
ncbi:plasmid pRiA4b ORF-3 family protein (plasmid) [Herpetosiphon aurantiacus DSM 785]|uniref:Plasmid pRiA4b ORF-3 family protein n=1 Tax=Herpetosiphon aurantiacus (strain ATCC 23779 / DSM 785 / 114-95) TaxID=316274 RepID=A9B902_HERA2|nr:plasmid pRiA4b ORF-3 family protein [Herpetosiphon aurantiacus DSM 785]